MPRILFNGPVTLPPLSEDVDMHFVPFAQPPLAGHAVQLLADVQLPENPPDPSAWSGGQPVTQTEDGKEPFELCYGQGPEGWCAVFSLRSREPWTLHLVVYQPTAPDGVR